MFLSDLKPGALIGSGSFGQVLSGVDPVHGPVAIKVFSKTIKDSNQEWAARVGDALKEAQLIASLQHQNIVKVYHFVRTPNYEHVLYVMELCQAGSVRSQLKASVPPLSAVRRWLYDAAMGIEFLHSRSVIHRDIKPDNVLIGDQGQAKVADFGLATTPLAHGFAGGAGTEFYAAPEVFGKNISSVASDVWSIGTTFVHALHGDEWFFSNFCDRSDRFKLSGRWLPHIPKSWRLCANRMLRLNPTERCSSAAAVVDQISRLPLTLDWDCAVAPHEVHWQLKKDGRRIKVVWDNLGTKAPKWRAWSEPDGGAGRARTLGRSEPGDGPQQTYQSLTQYFARQSA